MSQTDKPPEVTIVTIKGIEVAAWVRARKCAAANDEMMGPWITRAANLLADRQDQDGLFPPETAPGKPAYPNLLNSDALQLAYVASEMVQRILAMPVARPVKAEAQRILDTALLQAQGLPPRDQKLGLPRTISPPRPDKLALETPGPGGAGGTIDGPRSG